MRQGAAELLRLAPPGAREEAEVNLDLRNGGLTLAVTAEWPAEVAQGVVEVAVAPDGLPEQAQRAWGRGASAAAELTYAWPGAQAGAGQRAGAAGEGR